MTRFLRRLSPVCFAAACLACGQAHEAPDPNDGPAAPDDSAPIQAVALIEPKGDSSLTGTAIFSGNATEVTLTLEVRNASPGEHAFHLHEIGDCSSADGKSAGGHWNPTGAAHGMWGGDAFHLGDVGNLIVDQDGTGSLTLTTGIWSIGSGADNDVVGRSVIVHAGVDDFTSQPTGNAGGRIGCGVIQPR